MKYAYCVELNRVVSIFDARQEFLSQNTYSEYHFLCPNEACRRCGVEITGVCYQKSQEEYKRKPHYRSQQAHCPDCEWIQEINVARKKGESEEDFKARKHIASLHSHIDEFNLRLAKEKKDTTIHYSTTSSTKIIHSSIKNNGTHVPSPRKMRTHSLEHLVFYYLDVRECEHYMNIPLSVPGTNIDYLYKFFRKVVNAIPKQLTCVCIADCQLIENDNYFVFKGREQYKCGEKQYDIFICIDKYDFDHYQYKKAFRDSINLNKYPIKYFKVFFIPNWDDVSTENNQYVFKIRDINNIVLRCYNKK